MKKILFNWKLAVAAVLLAAIGSPIWLGKIVNTRIERNYAIVSVVILECPEGTSQAIERWGQVGHLISCRDGYEFHGPWQVWKDGRKMVEGRYASGKKDGPWHFFCDDGNLYKTIEYRLGNQIGHGDYNRISE